MLFIFNMLVSFVFLIISTIIVVSSSSWFSAWLGLEMNMMAFIPFIIKSNLPGSEGALKYFFIQAVGSALVFLGASCVMLYEHLSSLNISSISSSVIAIALLLKLGAAPLHFWFPAVVETLSYSVVAMLLTWQKMAPLFLLLIGGCSFYVMMFFILASALAGPLGGLNQLFLRNLLAFSSIAHMSWLLYALLLSEITFYFYFIIYCTINIIICLVLLSSQKFCINQMFIPQGGQVSSVPLMSLIFLSLGGLPPFLGFLPKWLVIKVSMNSPYLMITLLLLLGSVISLYFYLRLTYMEMTLLSANKSHLFHYEVILSLNKSIILVPLIFLPLLCFMLPN